LERRQSRRQIQAALLYGRVEAAAGVHPAKARRIAANIAKLAELLAAKRAT